MDLGQPFLAEQLIAYIGNKRALLPFLHGVFSRLVPDPSRAGFTDPFAGSGAVSRLARAMGFSVSANDWELYSYVINSCHIGLGASELERLFRGKGGLPLVLAELNGLPAPCGEARYISRHYAPASTERADWRSERLFYTTENALAIDAMRERIEEMYPGTPEEPAARHEKTALLAPLLYEAATHTNTSGVFKACHRGFGGHGRDALNRIMARIWLEQPVLLDSEAPSTVTCLDARAFLSGRGADICYLDPPYSGHQYGSNYFMLNSIARWDRVPVSDERGADGRLLHKAGIRPDWVATRSAFCYRDTALAALREVLAAADCRWLVLSYSDEGLIGLEELCDALAAEGSLSVQSTGYVKYPGGKQGLTRTTRNQELAIVVDRSTRPAPRMAVEAFAAAPSAATALLREVRLARLLGASFSPARIQASFSTDGAAIVTGRGPGAVRLPMRHFWRFAPDAAAPRFEDAESAEGFLAALSGCMVRDVREEIDILAGIAGAETERSERRALSREMLRLFNKLAHRKHRALFAETLQMLRGFAAGAPDLASFLSGLEKIRARAELRLR
jgi:adenine-specific DNA-methyltransferase